MVGMGEEKLANKLCPIHGMGPNCKIFNINIPSGRICAIIITFYK